VHSLSITISEKPAAPVFGEKPGDIMFLWKFSTYSTIHFR